MRELCLSLAKIDFLTPDTQRILLSARRSSFVNASAGPNIGGRRIKDVDRKPFQFP